MIICVSCATQVSLQQPDYSSSTTDDLNAALDNANFVGYVIKRSPDNMPSVLNCVEVFKTDNRAMIYENIYSVPSDNRMYLVVASEIDGKISRLLYRIKLVSNLSESELQILEDLPCYDKELPEKFKNGACTRDYFPVCGCDNKNYGNECEARRNGILRYTIGRCIE